MGRDEWKQSVQELESKLREQVDSLSRLSLLFTLQIERVATCGTSVFRTSNMCNQCVLLFTLMHRFTHRSSSPDVQRYAPSHFQVIHVCILGTRNMDCSLSVSLLFKTSFTDEAIASQVLPVAPCGTGGMTMGSL